MATVCQLSYPANSENASPPGTRTVYLACPLSCAMTALPPRAASTTATASAVAAVTSAGKRLLVISTPLLDRGHHVLIVRHHVARFVERAIRCHVRIARGRRRRAGATAESTASPCAIRSRWTWSNKPGGVEGSHRLTAHAERHARGVARGQPTDSARRLGPRSPTAHLRVLQHPR